MSQIKQESRFLNYSRNMIFALLYQFVIIVLSFIGRKVFINYLDIEYMGLNGLFSNVLTILSLAELGVGNAIIYSLYKPVKENNIEKIKSLMGFYKKAYTTIGIAIIGMGAIICPFVNMLIDEVPDIPNIKLIFMLFVLQTSISYFFGYKINFLLVVQKNYIIRIFDIINSIILQFLQILLLILYRNYYLYLALAIICPLLRNILITMLVNKRYPFLKEKYGKLDLLEIKSIRKNTFALLLYKISSSLSASIDTILVSKFLGLVQVAIYYNYHYLLTFSDKLFITVLGTITPSLGNFMVSESAEKKYLLFSTLQMIYYWISTYLAVGLVVLFNPIMETWLGKEYLFPQYMVVALVVSLTLTNFQRPCSLMRDSNGLFTYGKLRPLFMSIINIISSIIFVKLFGIIGVVLGTILSKISTYVWYDPYIVFKYSIKGSLKKYFFKYIYQWFFLIAQMVICRYLYNMMNVTGISGLIVGALMITVVVNGSFFLITCKTDEFIYLKGIIKNVLLKRKKR